MNFDDKDLLSTLEGADQEALDAQGFGIIAMDHTGTVLAYNRAESALTGLAPDRVLGRHFFSHIALCTNNAMVAQKYADRASLDEQLDYVFTFHLRPTRVRLRLLKAPGAARQYLVVRRA